MKKLTVLILCLAMALLAACGPGEQTTEGQKPGQSPTAVPDSSGVDAYADNNGNNVNYLCGIDMYGRVFNPVSGMDESKDVGMFYFIWHGESGRTTYNNTELLQNDPDTFWNVDINTNDFHYWGEPLFGYYYSSDKWVISRHIEMLTAAGIDYLVFDTTNGFVYKKTYTAVFEVLEKYREAGWDVPKVVFYTNSYSLNSMRNVYEDIYKQGKYKDSWYCPDGEKPMIIGLIDDDSDASFLEFFDFRASQWPNEGYKADGVPWMEWTYPQPIHNGIMNVSVAQHPNLPFSASIKDRSRNWGRGYSFETKENIEQDSRKGTNFQSQWDTALANKDAVNNVFVTGWNEWIAQKLNIEGNVWFVDCAVEEFSRDIEPMKGGYEDSFYMQLCDNVRRYKGVNEQVRKPDTATINVSGDIAQWDGIRNSYKAITSQSIERNSRSVDRKIKYIQEAARNNIQEVKLTNDSEKLYFMIRSQSDVAQSASPDFMNIYLGIGDLELKGWNGYEYVLSCGDKAVYALDESGARTKVADAEVSVNGRYVQAAVALDAISASGEQGVYFKVSDGVASVDIMDTYIQGKSLPMGRLSYYYYFG